VNRTRPGTYAFFGVAFLLLALVTHWAFLTTPYYWDEAGFYIPSALDFRESGSLVPHSTTPNAHPPGLRLWLAAVWRIAGVSLSATRVGMLVLAALGLLLTFRLTIELCQGLPGAPAFGAVALLMASPLFYMQAAMAQPEVPAMVAGLAAVVAYLRQRWAWSVAACVALVMLKETGIVFPLVLAAFAWRSGRRGVALGHMLPGALLAVWFSWLWLATGHVFGDAAFSDYNLVYNLQPARLAIALVRRAFTLFVENFHWLGTIALLNAWWKHRLYAQGAWPLIGALAAGHVLMVSFFGGAVLERYLVPVLPFFYAAVAAAWTLMSRRSRWLHQAGLTAGLVAGLWWNPPYPFPLENNLAMRDQVQLFQQAGLLMDALEGDPLVATAWPLSAALRDPRLGYVARRHEVKEVADFRPDSLKAPEVRPFEWFILYTREWDPAWNWMRVGWVRKAWQQIYQYRPPMTPEECSLWLGVPPVVSYEQRGLRLDIYRVKTRIQ